MESNRHISNRHIKIAGLALLLLAGCSIHVKDHERSAEDADKSKDKEVTIKSPFGGLHVDTDKVDPKQMGLSVYPGARLKEKENGNDSKANVNIDTPWFGLKVIALKYESDDPQEKIWDYYKKELSKYGKVLECRPGSPDLNIVAKEKNELTCDKGKSRNKSHVNIDSDENSLRVGREDHQRVVGIKQSSKGTEFDLVYVETRGDQKEKI
jgi:hypothetical protein